ncbi:MAG: FAD/NAD(P)-binding protein, partial [Nitratireductor sp.]
MRRCHSLSIDIVGGGFGMISILDQMNQHGLSCSDIRIYSADHAEIGDAYRPAPNLLLMNTKTQHLGFFDHVVNFAAWLARQPENRDRPKDFIPRAVFGAYLSEVRTEIERALLRRGNRLQRLGPATRIDREARVHKEDEAGPPSDLILLSPGYGRALDLVALANNILSMPCNGRVRIVGSGLSAIDLILLSEHLRPDLAIECISLSGRLPRIRS